MAPVAGQEVSSSFSVIAYFLPPERVAIVLPIAFATIGLMLTTVAGTMFVRRRAFLAKAVRTFGTVVANIRRQTSDSEGGTAISYAPRIEFVDAAGVKHAFDSSTGSGKPLFAEGSQAPILYPPDRPDEAIVDTFFDRWGVAFLLGVVGSIFLFLGIGIYCARLVE